MTSAVAPGAALASGGRSRAGRRRVASAAAVGAAPEARLDRCPGADGERWIDSATAMISATPLNMSLSQLAPDTSCSPCTPVART